MVDTSQQQVPVTNFFSVSDHHQHPVHAAASWQGQQEYTTAGADWTGQLQPQDSQEAAAVAAYQQQQEILLSQNFGMIMNQHQMAAAQAGFTSSNYFEYVCSAIFYSLSSFTNKNFKSSSELILK